MARKTKGTQIRPEPRKRLYYDPAKIMDAPEFYDLGRSMGTLTWATGDEAVRPVEERIRDFVFGFPPENPVVSSRGRLIRQDDGSYAPGTIEARLERFLDPSWKAGSLHEMLARYGLKVADGPSFASRHFEPGSFKEVARRRNVKLRVLHGGVDIEPSDMTAAKAEYLDRQEKRQAAEDVRMALRKMKDELDG